LWKSTILHVCLSFSSWIASYHLLFYIISSLKLTGHIFQFHLKSLWFYLGKWNVQFFTDVFVTCQSKRTKKVKRRNHMLTIYKITQVILAFWLVLAYDLLEDRRIDDSSLFLIFLILNLNQSQFFAKHSNQSVRFILYRH